MAAKKNPVPKHLTAKDKAIFKLVSTMGVNKNHCIQSLDLPPNYFTRYIGVDINFEKAKAKFTEKLMKATMSNIDFSDSNRKYLIQKTRCMDIGIKLPKIVDNKTAREALGIAIQAYARKELTDTELISIKTACSTFSDLSVHVDLQEKIEALEKLFIEKSNA